jgi:hypothetical protein
MRTGYRRLLKETLEKADKQGLSIGPEDPGDYIEILYNLYSQVMDRAPFQLERLNKEFFLNLVRFMKNESVALLVKQQDRILAGALLLNNGDTRTFLLAGIDYSCSRSSGAYLALITRIVTDAISDGVDQLLLGQTTYFLKRRLGAQALPVVLYLHHRNPGWNRFLERFGPMLFPETILEPLKVFRDV